jgi:hypothetical protein
MVVFWLKVTFEVSFRYGLPKWKRSPGNAAQAGFGTTIDTN